MTLWLWPATALIDAALVASLPHIGWWTAATLTIVALSTEFISGRMKFASMVLPTATFTATIVVIYLAERRA